MARAEEWRAGNAKTYRATQQRCPRRLPAHGRPRCPECSTSCVPAECDQHQLWACRMWPAPAVRLQKPSQTWAVLAVLQIAAKSVLCMGTFAAEGDVSRFLSSSTNIFPEGTLIFWLKNSSLGRRQAVRAHRACRAARGSARGLARRVPWEQRARHQGYPRGTAVGAWE